MKRTGMITIGVLLMTALTVGALWATGTAAPVTQEPQPLPEIELPGEVPAEDVGICGPSYPTCNSGNCSGPGCQKDASSCSSVDLGVRCCSNNGNSLQCPPGQTAHVETCDCGTGGIGFCEQTSCSQAYCG